MELVAVILGASLATTFLGLAVGIWIIFIGVPLVIIALIGWVYEYYRGNFARGRRAARAAHNAYPRVE